MNNTFNTTLATILTTMGFEATGNRSYTISLGSVAHGKRIAVTYNADKYSREQYTVVFRMWGVRGQYDSFTGDCISEQEYDEEHTAKLCAQDVLRVVAKHVHI